MKRSLLVSLQGCYEEGLWIHNSVKNNVMVREGLWVWIGRGQCQTQSGYDQGSGLQRKELREGCVNVSTTALLRALQIVRNMYKKLSVSPVGGRVISLWSN